MEQSKTIDEINEEYEERMDTAFQGWVMKRMYYSMTSSRAKGRFGWHNPDLCKVDHLEDLAAQHASRGPDQYIDAAILYLMAAYRYDHA